MSTDKHSQHHVLLKSLPLAVLKRRSQRKKLSDATLHLNGSPCPGETREVSAW